MESKAIKGFDGLRAIAVLLVVLGHSGLSLEMSRTFPLLSPTTGVIIFFALSGFLITTLLKNEHETTGTISLSAFYMRRLLRIVPLYFLVLAAIAIAATVEQSPLTTPRAFAFAAVYMTNFIPKAWYSGILGHTWSLAVEEHFYLLWPAMLMVLLPFRYMRGTVILLCICIAISFAMLNVTINVHYLADRFFLYRWTPFAGAAIAFGCVGAMSAHNSILRTKTALILALMLFSIRTIVPVSGIAAAIPDYFDLYLQGAGAALLVSWIAINQSNYLVSFLELAPLRYIGTVSYGIYMWQGLFLSNGPFRQPGQIWPPHPSVGFACLVIVVPLSFHFFERPILRLKRRFVLQHP